MLHEVSEVGPCLTLRAQFDEIGLCSFGRLEIIHRLSSFVVVPVCPCFVNGKFDFLFRINLKVKCARMFQIVFGQTSWQSINKLLASSNLHQRFVRDALD